jgi:hypothetical protein
VSVYRSEVTEIQVAGREFFIGSCVADFRFEGRQFFGVAKVELVLEDGCTGIAVLVGNSVIHPRLRFAIGFYNRLPPLLGRETIAFRDRGAAFHLGGIVDSLHGTYLPEAPAAYDKAGCFGLLRR